MPETSTVAPASNLSIRYKPVTLHDKADAIREQAAAFTQTWTGTPPLSPQERRDDAVLAGVQAKLSDGARLAEVVSKLRQLRADLREVQQHSGTVFRAGLIMRLGDIIKFAESGK